MLSKDQRMKLKGEYNVNWSPQKQATFNKNMRSHLKERIKELSELIIILENLPPKVLENAKLMDELPKVVEFVDAFLETVSPHPVGTHESGETRVFFNFAVSVDGRLDIADLERNWYIENINGKKYRIASDSWKASPWEIRLHEILTKHAENIQKYIDPGAVSTIWDGKSVFDTIDREEMERRAELLGAFEASQEFIQSAGCIPTNPPSTPRILIDRNEPK
jgi:hypothetical protein